MLLALGGGQRATIYFRIATLLERKSQFNEGIGGILHNHEKLRAFMGSLPKGTVIKRVIDCR